MSPTSQGALSSTYPSSSTLMSGLREVVTLAGGTESIAGTSVEGRPLPRFDLGTPGRPVVLLTALMHGVEVIGSLALLEVLRRLGAGREPHAKSVMGRAHIVVFPIMNPDAFEKNMAKVASGRAAWQRCNANGVDLNRNFPRLTTNRLVHPFSGSRFKVSPHYRGPHALSEPESRAIFRVAGETRPTLSLAFHSFGNLLLYPWAYTHQANPREAEYRALGAALTEGLRHHSYRVHQARQLYSVLGDMDDWLDAEHGTLAFTVEVGRPELALADGRNLLNPFRWMNSLRVAETVDNLAPGILALIAAAVGIETVAEFPAPARPPGLPLDFAAK